MKLYENNKIRIGTRVRRKLDDKILTITKIKHCMYSGSNAKSLCIEKCPGYFVFQDRAEFNVCPYAGEEPTYEVIDINEESKDVNIHNAF